MNLPEKEKQYFSNLYKGYEGELLFDSYIEKLQSNCLVLNDLLLKSNNTTFQIDTLLIMSDMIYIFEVKNYEGDFYFEKDKLYTKSKVEIVSPLIQLSRTESLFRQLLNHLGFTIPVQAFVVFVNPEFTLYQAPMDSAFIFPTQINRFLKQLNAKYSKITEKHMLIAEKLLSLHMSESPFNKLPVFEFEQLKKGITCATCNSFDVTIEGRKLICKNCGHPEAITSSVIRCVKELRMLFPEIQITTNLVQEWCRIVESKKLLRNILNNHFKRNGKYSRVYFE